MKPQLGRAHLLQALYLRPMDRLTLEHSSEMWVGYEDQTEDAEHNVDTQLILEGPAATGHPISPPQNMGLSAPRNPLHMPEAWVAKWLGDKSERSTPDEDRAAEPLSAAELQPPDEPQGSYRDLVPLPRLMPALKRRVHVPRPGGPDVQQLLGACAKRQWPRHLPRTQSSAWPQRLVLLIDCRVQLYPYRHDFFKLAQALKAAVSAGQLSIYSGDSGPDGPWEPWMAAPELEHEELDGLPAWREATVLLLSDLGLLSPAPTLQGHWQARLLALKRLGNTVFSLAPVASHDIPAQLAETVQILRWAPNSRLYPEQGRSHADAADELAEAEASALEQLLACLGGVLRMDPPLLRAMRQACAQPGHIGLEGKLWAHPSVSGTSYASLRSTTGRRQTTPLPGHMAKVLEQARQQHHGHWSLGMQVVDQMHLLAARPDNSEALLQTTRQSIIRLARAAQADAEFCVPARRAAGYVLSRVPAITQPQLADVLDALAESLGAARAAKVTWSLMQKGERLEVLPRPTLLEGPGIVLAEDLGQAAAGEALLLEGPGLPVQVLRLPELGSLVLAEIRPESRLTLGGVRTWLTKVRRTRGLVDWQQMRFAGTESAQQTKHGLIGHVQLPWPEGSEPIKADSMGRAVNWLLSEPFELFEANVGFDQYGVYLGLRPKALATEGEVFPAVRNRFRYLPPATFQMGSTEGGGYGDEHPQHPVTLSQGLWLAETPCTQALWQAVMGDNPSHFSEGTHAPLRPVENVSWNDVQLFLSKLNVFLPEGCEAVLPTEAQWEYACRAGTSTAYWWGDEPDESKANFDSQREKKLDAKDGTSPVDRYPPNPWGLRDMHGNVWEWCADGQRTYEQLTAREPRGGTGGEGRVLRGGSWFDHPGNARSACRSRRHRAERNRIRGFRFALRSSSNKGAEPQPERLTAGNAAEGRRAGIQPKKGQA